MFKKIGLVMAALSVIHISNRGQTCDGNKSSEMAVKIEYSLKNELLKIWYPASIDTIYGGFLSNFSYDFKPLNNQEKMIVTQSRHTWVNAKASLFYPDDPQYPANTLHGFSFLKYKMWDTVYGGFYTLVSRDGKVIHNSNEEKTAYGNAFAIYALAACYNTTHNEDVLNLAKETFRWLEQHSHDTLHKGYFQSLKRNGDPVLKAKLNPSGSALGYKDQNSSIHLLEAFSELYSVWPDPLLRLRLEEMLYLIRDTIVNEKDYMTLFFKPDWTPVSFKNSKKPLTPRQFQFDHVSFGHDVEVAFLMLEASEKLNITDDQATLKVAKKLVDHALQNGWDTLNGGFFDAGYYYEGKDKITIIQDTKNWWAQAEGLNSLLLMADYFPEDKMDYYNKFLQQWNYIDKFLIDHTYGDWYPGGLDKEPESGNAFKGHIWKGCYHQYRALENCVKRLEK